MANNWAIAIGINQYQFFQPLGCPQADAEALRDYLVTEGGFLPQQCLLMTDTSAPFGDRSTYPSKDNILRLVEDLAAACWQPQDKLWFFFSGYGVNYNGQDYLMPIAGDPERIQETGIDVRSLLQVIQITEVNALVLFDINRAFASQGNNYIGQETIELAQELQVSTILSCQPEQFSHESRQLGHGFFTAALIEALRSGNGKSLTNLESYLSVRTPELCHHYWRPTQNPVTIIAAGNPEIIGIPTKTDITQPGQTHRKIPPEEISEDILSTAKAAPKLQSDYLKNYTSWQYNNSNNTEENAVVPVSPPPLPQLPEVGQSSGNITPIPSSQKPPESNQPAITKQLLLWVGSTILLLGLMVVVVLRNQAGFQTNLDETQQDNTTDVNLNQQRADVKTLPTLARANPSAFPTTPKPQRTPTSQTKQENQALLDLAKMSLKKTQASDLSQAIATARKIKPGEPLYQQAQENILIWSRMIFDLAEGRAKRGKYSSAIAAAQLLTKDGPLYPKAQAGIKRWQFAAKRAFTNKTLLDAAKVLIKNGQASSYNRAIVVANKVAAGEPGFDIARKSIDKWSEKILAIAQKRANRGRFKDAIQTAVLVPEGTAAYNKAQTAIKKWQSKK
ncbi:caspase family protein [Calothrix rhizosoleniae]|uniref:caspase family protein n=1 Tax=Calothrix rhizosoleniae TaxID=888997 RepID=UPI000B49ECE2|nr:caspase family protein [Calothrix rhizosoleniae]